MSSDHTFNFQGARTPPAETPESNLYRLICDFINHPGTYADDPQAAMRSTHITKRKRQNWFRKGEIPRQFYEYLADIGRFKREDIPERKCERTIRGFLAVGHLTDKQQRSVDPARLRSRDRARNTIETLFEGLTPWEDEEKP